MQNQTTSTPAALFQNAFITEVDDRVASVSKNYALILGYDPGTLLNAPIEMLIAEQDRPRLREFAKSRIEGLPAPARYEFFAKRAAGDAIRVIADVSMTDSGKAITTRLHCPDQPIVSRDDLALAYDVYSPILYSLALRFTRDSDTAADVLKTTFASAWTNRRTFDPSGGTLLSWLVRTTRESARLSREAKKQDREAHFDEALAPSLSRVRHTAPAHDVFSVQKAFSTLGSVQKEVLSLSCIEGRSLDEVAAATRLDRESVRRTATSAMQQLRGALIARR